MGHIFSSFKEAFHSVIPIALIVLVLSVTCIPLDADVLVMFVFGTVLLILGMSFLRSARKFPWNLWVTVSVNP